MPAESNACKTVAKGGVGESGATALLVHTVSGPTSKMMVLRNVASSLCPNTGAVAMLLVNGVPMASGNITAQGSSIQTEAAPGSCVVGIIHSIPLFNNIVCVRLGELTAHLDECDLVAMSGSTDRQACVITADNIATRDWTAWIDQSPPPPDVLHVVGEVQVPNPGVETLLVPRNPQGVNSKILLLDLILTQKPGIWPQILVWKQARYEKPKVKYDSIQIFHANVVIANVPVDVVS